MSDEQQQTYTPPPPTEDQPLPSMDARTPIEERIQGKLDRAAISGTAVDMTLGGVQLDTMVQVMEFAKLMALSGAAVPKFLRGNAGGCLAVCSRALRWKLDPFAVAEQTYIVFNKGEERIAFMSQLIHAVIEMHAPIVGRLRYEIRGEGDEMRCYVWGTFRGERQPHTYLSEPLAKLREARGRNESGGLKGSPLWETKPELQLWYNASRDWARMWCPDVLLGAYAVDEMVDHGWRASQDVTPTSPGLLNRLKDAGGNNGSRGFAAMGAEALGASQSTLVAELAEAAATAPKPAKAPRSRPGKPSSREKVSVRRRGR